MIIQKEIINISKEKGVPKITIDKDWVLGHFLNAMYSFVEIQNNFVFKGGTCLRKCHIEDYRFSEDLDFTLLDEKFIIHKELISKFIHEAQKVCGAKFHLFKFTEPNEDNQGYEIIIKFWGADHKINQKPTSPSSKWHSKIKLDISISEDLILKPEIKKIFHPYSDSKLINNTIPVYSINEIMAEKLRSLIQRNRPRDIYDVWSLSKIIDNKEFTTIKDTLLKKSENKNIKINGVNDFINDDKEKKNNKEWRNSLKNQLPIEKLPEFDKVYNIIPEFIKNILNN